MKAILLSVLLLAAPTAAWSADGALSDDQVRKLSNGYALVYQITHKLNQLPKLLYVKFESDAVDDLATRLGEHASSVLASAEDHADSHPGIELGATGLPLVERERRSKTKLTLLKDLATRGGTDFERLFLLAMLNLLNQLRHASEALSELEQDRAGIDLARSWQQRFDEDYDAVPALLQSSYFVAGE